MAICISPTLDAEAVAGDDGGDEDGDRRLHAGDGPLHDAQPEQAGDAAHQAHAPTTNAPPNIARPTIRRGPCRSAMAPQNGPSRAMTTEKAGGRGAGPERGRPGVRDAEGLDVERQKGQGEGEGDGRDDLRGAQRAELAGASDRGLRAGRLRS